MAHCSAASSASSAWLDSVRVRRVAAQVCVPLRSAHTLGAGRADERVARHAAARGPSGRSRVCRSLSARNACGGMRSYAWQCIDCIFGKCCGKRKRAQAAAARQSSLRESRVGLWFAPPPAERGQICNSACRSAGLGHSSTATPHAHAYLSLLTRAGRAPSRCPSVRHGTGPPPTNVPFTTGSPVAAQRSAAVLWRARELRAALALLEQFAR